MNIFSHNLEGLYHLLKIQILNRIYQLDVLQLLKHCGFIWALFPKL